MLSDFSGDKRGTIKSATSKTFNLYLLNDKQRGDLQRTIEACHCQVYEDLTFSTNKNYMMRDLVKFLGNFQSQFKLEAGT